MRELHPSETEGWQNGVTLKRTRDGYCWTIAVAASGPTYDQLVEAAHVATDVDAELRETYRPLVK